MRTRLQWRPRVEPLLPAAVAATGSGRDRLSADAVDRIQAGAALRAIADTEWIVFLGGPGDLPWADGAIYLGWDGGLLVHTALEPSIPADLLRRALDRPADEIIAVLPGAILSGQRPTRAADVTSLAP
jgi:hypothetical protein